MTCREAAGVNVQTQSETQRAAIQQKRLLGSWKMRT